MLCRRTTVFPIECVIRGYLSGSAWKEYAGSGTLAGEKLKAGLVESEKLEPSIFSPATKAETGHDENITIAKMREVVGDETAYTLESMTRAIYTLGEELAREQGIIIADTKFEFGRDKDGRIILIDEVMTPDSSRFWAVDAYKPGQPQPSFDKQPLARLSRRRAPRRPLERRRPAAAAAGKRGRGDQQALSGSVSAGDGEGAENLATAVVPAPVRNCAPGRDDSRECSDISSLRDSCCAKPVVVYVSDEIFSGASATA